jgi:hypothetical protein
VTDVVATGNLAHRFTVTVANRLALLMLDQFGLRRSLSGAAAPNDGGGGERDQAAAVCTKTIVTDFHAKSPAVADRAPSLAGRRKPAN